MPNKSIEEGTPNSIDEQREQQPEQLRSHSQSFLARLNPSQIIHSSSTHALIKLKSKKKAKPKTALDQATLRVLLAMPELLLWVAQFLRRLDWSRASLVCKTWSLVFGPLVWRSITIDSGSSSTWKARTRTPIMAAIERRASWVRHLNMVYEFMPSATSSSQSNSAFNLAMHCKNLQVLTIKNGRNRCLPNVITFDSENAETVQTATAVLAVQNPVWPPIQSKRLGWNKSKYQDRELDPVALFLLNCPRIKGLHLESMGPFLTRMFYQWMLNRSRDGRLETVVLSRMTIPSSKRVVFWKSCAHVRSLELLMLNFLPTPPIIALPRHDTMSELTQQIQQLQLQLQFQEQQLHQQQQHWHYLQQHLQHYQQQALHQQTLYPLLPPPPPPPPPPRSVPWELSFETMLPGVFRLQHLWLHGPQGLTLVEQVQLLKRCPSLKTLYWITRMSESLPKTFEDDNGHTEVTIGAQEAEFYWELERFSDPLVPMVPWKALQDLVQGRIWKNMESLMICDESLPDTMVAKIIEGMAAEPLSILRFGVPSSGFGIASFEALRPSFPILNVLNLHRCRFVRSGMVQEILSSSPCLRLLFADHIHSSDIYYGRSWVCQKSLEVLKVDIILDGPLPVSAPREAPGLSMERMRMYIYHPHQEIVMVRLGSLIRLKYLDLNQARSRLENHQFFVSMLYSHGLQYLGHLKRLRHFSYVTRKSYRRQVNVQSVRWMRKYWPRLEHVELDVAMYFSEAQNAVC
ncbi:hypothetical protein BGZ83_003301 [Gryganskiella cystojenkinii]|nr:hypothetical protein BGZ83_003301 [Gryganskiella cystojenkinii]